MLAKHMNRQTKNLERMNKEMEVRAGRRANLEVRNKWHQAKNIKNYQSEYDRIRTHMANSVVPFTTVQQLTNRRTVLERLGAQAFDGMQ